MTLREVIQIAAPPERVWPYVADPALMAGWNPKLVDIRRSLTGPVRLGESFEATFRMGGKDRDCVIDVIECDPPRRLVLRHRPREAGDRYADLAFDLSQGAGGCRLVQRFNLDHWGIHFFLRCLIRFIHIFGSPVGRTYLQQLKEQVEQEAIPAAGDGRSAHANAGH